MTHGGRRLVETEGQGMLMRLKDWLDDPEPTSQLQVRSQAFHRQWRRFRSNPLAILGLSIVVILLFTAVLAPWLAPYSPYDQSLDGRLLPPNHQHWFGTDELGRDILSRIIYGARVSLYVVILVTLLKTPVGLLVGVTAGYAGGLVDAVLMRVTDIFLAFPGLILTLAFAAALGPGLENAVIAISLSSWPGYARLVRAQTMTIRSRDFVSAARAYGASPLRIILGHVVPMVVPTLCVRAAMSMAGIILAGASLGFLGMGAQPPTAEWGAMLADGRRYMLDHWWTTAIPGAAILIVSLGFNLLGDGLRDVLDRRTN